MTNDPMTDRELNLWREQWGSVARPSPEFQGQVQKRIKLKDRCFWLGNLLAAAALAGMLILAVYQLSHQTSRFERGEATGVCVLLLVAIGNFLIRFSPAEKVHPTEDPRVQDPVGTIRQIYFPPEELAELIKRRYGDSAFSSEDEARAVREFKEEVTRSCV
jgi:hypothetical protein